MSTFKTKDYNKSDRVKTVCEGGKKQSEENISRSISNLFELKKKMKQLKILEIEISGKKRLFYTNQSR